ncbi:pentapeptide repeat-containing protein [Streptomyces sp. DSM 44917]|uniref:Pentapeptide repeat-containing protein n=1 Tax=Streptomyces boetiae TaxID=3075541 RepID=A0ABU2LFJ4_9ACTN|nr:pentapeptide repeat-containing protein [Streptomyces sp. DSM 44917]MDT0310027.1 pentapeptide repeat-containing protein [Streptomyces sp. DSM 44917]
MLREVLAVLRQEPSERPEFVTARFAGAEFVEDTDFSWVRFGGALDFKGARFAGGVSFREARFSGLALFEKASFAGDVEFRGADFEGLVSFADAAFGGRVDFGRAGLKRDANFLRATFSRDASFERVRFGEAIFVKADFAGEVSFSHGAFSGLTLFDEASFAARADFSSVGFGGEVSFSAARFGAAGTFSGAAFQGRAPFDGATFVGSATFDEARFHTAPELGPFTCGGETRLDGAVFDVPVTIEIAGGRVVCRRTRWENTATLRLRRASIDLRDAVLNAPVAVIAHPTPFEQGGRPLSEELLAGEDPGVRVLSVSGVDAAMLVLAGTDVSECVFGGAFHLDQIRLEGRITFWRAPPGWRTRRRVLAEERDWRALRGQWPGRDSGPPRELVPGPAAIAATYRHLRKALEDGKNEPGAAAFYYGECEMRRHDREGTPAVERWLLTAYWALSGYGLRALRALAWLVAAMAATVLVMALWGLPAESPRPEFAGRVGADGEVALTSDTPPPVNPRGGLGERLTGERAERALRVVINSVVFRSSGQELTTAGTYTEMGSRLVEPVLLGLAVLAVRARVKR